MTVKDFTKLRIIQYTLEDGSQHDFKTLPLNFFYAQFPNDAKTANHFFLNQREHYEQDLMCHFKLDIQDFAKKEFSLIPVDEQKILADFSDSEIEEEFISRRGVLEISPLQNENIINENFLSRFVTIINRGNDADIETVLNALEEKYRIK